MSITTEVSHEELTEAANDLLKFILKHKILYTDKSTSIAEEKGLKRLIQLRLVEPGRRDNQYILTQRGEYCAERQGINTSAFGFYLSVKKKQDRINSLHRIKGLIVKLVNNELTRDVVKTVLGGVLLSLVLYYLSYSLGISL